MILRGFYIQDVGISAKGLRPKRRCFAKKPLKSPQKDSALVAGLSAAAKGLRIWKKLLMEIILVLVNIGFGLCFNYFAIFSQVFIDFSPPGSNDNHFLYPGTNDTQISFTYNVYETNVKSLAPEYARILSLFSGLDQSISRFCRLAESYKYFLLPHT